VACSRAWGAQPIPRRTAERLSSDECRDLRSGVDGLPMPVMDGLAATGEIRRREQASGPRGYRSCVDANAMEGDRERCLPPNG